MNILDGNKLSAKERVDIEYTKCQLGSLLSDDNCLELIRSNPNYDYMMHVIVHRQAFRLIEIITEYIGVFSDTHDVDKVGLGLILGKESARTIHKKITPHHNIDWEHPDKELLVEKMIDYESCHYTKLGHPETAYEYVLATKKDHMDILEPILKELNYWGFENSRPLTEESYNRIVANITESHIISELEKSYQYISDNWNFMLGVN